MAVIKDNNINLSTDIGQVLNAAGGSVNINQPLTYFTTAAKINKWSKKKPVSFAQAAPLLDNQFKLANYGLSVEYSSGAKQPQSIIIDAAKGKDFYPYQLPTGGEKSPYRLSDFVGYNTDAVAPYDLSVSTAISVQSFPATIPFTVILNNSEFKLTDLQVFEDLFKSGYFAILYSTGLSTNSQVMMYKPSNPSQYANKLYGEISVNSAGTYHIVGVYAKQQASNGTTDVSSIADNYMPIPNGYAKVVVSRNVVYGYIDVYNLVSGSLWLDRETMAIRGFGSVPYATTRFPNGSTPACSYYLGFYATLSSDWGEYTGEWYFTEQTISHNGGDSGSTSYLDLFPSQISLSDLFRMDFDSGINIYSIRLTLELQKASGEGFLGFDKTIYYDITL